MIRYSVQSRDRIFEGYGFLSFAKIMDRNIDKNVSKNVRGKYSWKPLDQAKQYAAEAFKTPSKREIQKSAETISDLIGNKVADKSLELHHIMKKNILDLVKKYLQKAIYLQKKEKIIDNLKSR